MMNTIFLKGKHTLDSSKLFTLLTKENIKLKSVEINEVFAVKVKDDSMFLNSMDIDSYKINELLYLEKNPVLNYKNFSSKNDKDFYFLTFPRRGTHSPWASKSLDIFKKCSISEILNIERGYLHHIKNSNGLFNSLNPKRFTVKKNIAEFEIFENFYDPMIEEIFFNTFPDNYFTTQKKKKLLGIKNSKVCIKEFSISNGLALTDHEIEYVLEFYNKTNKSPTDLELMMFAQINSEHCRHKIFNSKFNINGIDRDETPFQIIKDTYSKNPEDILVAYSDNAAVINGFKSTSLSNNHIGSGIYKKNNVNRHLVLKAETHNHPTGISPFPGAATGAGGEIRDESATGIGAKTIAGFTGFCVSNINFKNENTDFSLAKTTPLEIMIKGPLGSADFNNEYGRPTVAGYFRSFELFENDEKWGFNKPIMLAGGIGLINEFNVFKKKLIQEDLIIILGGPGFKIGVGGGAASSMNSGDNKQDLDFKSVQRGNPEMQRRVQEVINTCSELKEKNPIKSIHDIGAGGLCNAVPELVNDSDVGADIDLNEIPIHDDSMSPLEIWCNESQERYVIGISKESLRFFSKICLRENAPFSVIGKVIREKKLVLKNHTDLPDSENFSIELPLSFLFNNNNVLKKTIISEQRLKREKCFDVYNSSLDEIIKKVISHPTVGSKNFLITISDRTVGGLTARDQMVGPWQTPVADVSVISQDFDSNFGYALSLGERAPIAIFNSSASVRISFAELITNMLAAPISLLSDIKICANWMASSGSPNQDAELFNAVDSLRKICNKFKITIPVGKDSLSMKSINSITNTKETISPVSVNLSGVAKIEDVRNVWTPSLDREIEESILIFVDLANGKSRLGSSIFASVQHGIIDDVPDLESHLLIDRFSLACTKIREYERNISLKYKNNDSEIKKNKLIHAYHDKSDGGLFACLCEMSFAGRVGITLNIDLLTIDGQATDWGDFKIRRDQVSARRNELTLRALFNEEIGVVLQTSKNVRSQLFEIFRDCGLGKNIFEIAKFNSKDEISIFRDAKCIFKKPRAILQKFWFETSKNISSLRDNFEYTKTEEDQADLIISPEKVIKLTFPIEHKFKKSECYKDHEKSERKLNIIINKPRVGILREQGINGQNEMAAAFIQAGFEAWDVHMNDLIDGSTKLNNFEGIAVGGGFSYGDVLGAGKGWASTIQYNQKLCSDFENFFDNPKKFVLGVCNGCQFVSELSNKFSSSRLWPNFKINLSSRFESRQSLVEILQSNSIFLKPMAGSILPVVVSHGYGRVDIDLSNKDRSVDPAIRYVDFNGKFTEKYPDNPNGSVGGLTAFSSFDGRITIMMPHPERCFKLVQMSWYPKSWNNFGSYSPWAQLFKNAYNWVNDS